MKYSQLSFLLAHISFIASLIAPNNWLALIIMGFIYMLFWFVFAQSEDD